MEVNRLDQLLSAERNQHAENDDPDLARELAPAVEGFGGGEPHQGSPIGQTLMRFA